MALKHVSLVAAYDYCQSRTDGGKLFTAILDVFINFLLVYCDMCSAVSLWSQTNPKDPGKEQSVLDSVEVFFGKMDCHRYNSSFVLRYRALWDKLMGLLVLMYVPAQYERFSSASSRKKTFFKIVRESSLLTEDNAGNLIKLLEGFDNEFRTPEAHGTGALRKWSFNMVPMQENPSIKLLGYWNVVNDTMSRLGKSFVAGSSKSV